MKNIHMLLLAFAALAVLLFPAKAEAQEFSLAERMDKLEGKLEKLPRISGFLNMRYQWADDDSRNSFDIRRARLDFKGDIGKKFDYRLQVEFANNPRILDAYFNWKIDKRFNVQAGQFKIPFSLENAYGPHQLETIDNSMVITSLSGYSDLSGISSNGRDIGIAAWGGFLPRNGYNLIDYSVGIFNGNGINVRDNNNSKDFSGIISFHPVKTVTLSLSHYNGAAGVSGSTSQRVRTGGGARYDDGKLLIRGEYIHGTTGRLKSQGWYAVAAYYIHPKVQPLLKYDAMQTDNHIKDTRQTAYIAGINYFPIKNVRLQLNYTYRSIKNANDINTIAFQVFGLF